MKGGIARTQSPATKNYTPHLLRFGVVAGFIMARSAMGPTRPGAAALLITADPAPGKYALALSATPTPHMQPICALQLATLFNLVCK
jgi:hypothetical protein